MRKVQQVKFIKSFLLNGLAITLTIGCEHDQIAVSVPQIPRITQIAAPQSVELPRTVKLTCEVENSESHDLQYRWETSSGTIVGDSSTVTFFTPNVESEVTVSCSISDSSMIYDTESTQISVTVPGFVGNYVLKTLTVCDSTITMDTDAPSLIWEIYDTHTSGKGFAYSWKVVRLGIPTPDSCHLQMPGKTHNGFMGKWRRGGSTDADSLIFFSYPIQLGYITRIVKWSKRANQLIIGRTPTDTWIFEER